jgi:hypothetical protein
MNDESDEPEKSCRRGYQQGAYDVLQAPEGAIGRPGRTFIALRDPLPADVATKAAEMSALPAANDLAADDELAALSRRYHWRPGDLSAKQRAAGRPHPPHATVASQRSASSIQHRESLK